MKRIKWIFLLLFIFSCSSIRHIKIDKEYNKTNFKQETSNRFDSNKIGINNEVRVKLTTLEKNKISLEYLGKKYNIYGSNNNIVVNGDIKDEIILGSKEEIIKIDNNYFYGYIKITSTDSKLQVINTLDVEQYLLGVLPYEIPSLFPLEALKAQAVIARTYTYRNILKNRNNFDLDNTTKYQVYMGIPTKNIDRIREAVNQTKDDIIVYNGEIIDALFHSYSGGYVASAKEVYGNDIAYLQSKEDNYSNYVPKDILTWRYFIENNKLINSIGFIVKDFDIEYSNSNRVLKVILYNENKTKYKILSGREFRTIFSNKLIKSTAFTLEITDLGLNVIGSGYGHGVGFSQWSSKSMAEDDNLKYIDIIKFFYNGVDIIKKVQ